MKEKEHSMLSIRLRRTGSSKKPYYRVVVAESTNWRDGRFVEILGHYDPRRNPAVVNIDSDRANYWISKGAQPSETVQSLLKRSTAAAPAPAPATTV
jgi:small subunit ribosomal protein S16